NGAPLKPGGVSGTVAGNVFLDSRDFNGSPRGWAMDVGNIKAGAGTSIRDNIIASDTAGNSPAIRLDIGTGVENAADGVGINDLTIAGNIVFKWNSGLYTASGFVNGGTGMTGYNRVTIRDNDFQQMN